MTTHGTARFAERDELRAADLIAPEPDGDAGRGLLTGWWFESRYDFQPIRYDGDLHQLIVAGTGGGKFTTAIGPMLLGSGLEDQTVVVIDPKGEIADLAGPFFATPFAKQANVILLDPWDQCDTGQTAVLNVLAAITPENPRYVDDARALADAMIIPSGKEHQHWDNAARNLLTAVLLYVALDAKEEGKRDLIRVREIVTLPWAMGKSYKGPKRPTFSSMVYSEIDSGLAGGAVARGFRSLINREDKERSGILSSIERDTAWIDSPQMERVLRGESLDLSESAMRGQKYFVVVPPDFFKTHRAWIRLMVTAFAKALKRSRSKRRGSRVSQWRHIVIDEFATLGEMSFILEEVAIARGYDVKYHLVVQDFAQLKLAYKDGWESFVNNSFQRFFAIGDQGTAEYVSRLLGSATVTSDGWSTGTSGGESTSFSESDSVNSGVNYGDGARPATRSSGQGSTTLRSISSSRGWTQTHSMSQVQRFLLTPDEVRRVPANYQLIFFRGLHPIRSWRPPYWECFPSLPDFTLKEALGTVGRQPRSKAERRRFMAWRERPLLIKPDAKPEETVALPAPELAPLPPEEKPLDYRIKLAMGFATLLFLLWLSPDRPQAPSAPKPQPQRVEVTPAPLPATSPPPLPTRAAIPSSHSFYEAPRGPETQQYLVKLMREHVGLCHPSHALDEKRLMRRLYDFIAIRRSLNYAPDRTKVDKYNALLRQYLRQASWTRSDREEVFELILRMALTTYPNDVDAVFDRLYAGNTCPLGEVKEADYAAPVYAEMTLPLRQ
jgi:type IV secretory pathway TraG/TraD family ATPase VirD4